MIFDSIQVNIFKGVFCMKKGFIRNSKNQSERINTPSLRGNICTDCVLVALYRTFLCNNPITITIIILND